MAIDRDKLREYLGNDLHVDLSEVDDQSPLFTSGIVDSFAIVELMLFLETQLGTKLDPEDIRAFFTVHCRCLSAGDDFDPVADAACVACFWLDIGVFDKCGLQFAIGDRCGRINAFSNNALVELAFR